MGHLCGKDDFIVQGIEICLAEMLRATSYERRATSYRGASWMHFQDQRRRCTTSYKLSRSILDALPGRAPNCDQRPTSYELRATNYSLHSTLSPAAISYRKQH
jgi:hypothetical protein